jgi:hypothetical protein
MIKLGLSIEDDRIEEEDKLPGLEKEENVEHEGARSKMEEVD